jgi:hypothetical protein
MTFKKLGLLLVAAGTAAFLVACGDTSGTDGGTAGCTSTSCASGETCLASAKVCVKTCTMGADCPDSAKTCAPLGGGASDGGAMFCQCSTDPLCNGTSGGSLVCSKLDKVCVPKCGSTTDCSSPRTCDTGTGQCQTGTVDAGSPDAGSGCFPGYCTPETNTCSLTTGLCSAPITCTSANTEPDVCSYGQWCKSTNSCSDVPALPDATTCPNFGPSSSTQPAWTLPGDNGPIIFAVDALPGDVNDTGSGPFCTSLKNFTGTIGAYNWVSTFPIKSQPFQLQAMWYVRTDGQRTDMVAPPAPQGPSYRPSGYNPSADLKEASIKFTLCAPLTAADSLPAGFFFTRGNEICPTLQH